MIKIENTHVDNIARAVYSARNAMNSWDKSDSDLDNDILGEADLKLARNLAKAGTDHSKFARMINVTCDITAGHTWWAEFDTYKIGVVRNSCSKMHKIHVKEFVFDDFDHKGIAEVSKNNLYVGWVFREVIKVLEWLRKEFNRTNDKMYWRAIIELLPMGYHLRATVQMNYQVLWNIHEARKNHKLDEWHTFCDWIETLPYFKEIYLGD